MNQMNTTTKREIKQRRIRRRTTQHHTQMTKSRRKTQIFMKIIYLESISLHVVQ